MNDIDMNMDEYYGDREYVSERSDFDLIDAYVSLEEEHHKFPLEHYDPLNWNICPRCGSKPKIWEFDNGRFAACKCYSKYCRKDVSAIPVMKYIKNNGGSLREFPHRELMDNWNKRCEELKKILQESGGDILSDR